MPTANIHFRFRLTHFFTFNHSHSRNLCAFHFHCVFGEFVFPVHFCIKFDRRFLLYMAFWISGIFNMIVNCILMHGLFLNLIQSDTTPQSKCIRLVKIPLHWSIKPYMQCVSVQLTKMGIDSGEYQQLDLFSASLHANTLDLKLFT